MLIKKHLSKLILALVLVAIVVICVVVPPVNELVGTILMMFASGDFHVVSDFVASYGVWAAVVSFLLMVFQSVLAPIPAFLITFANANLFGWWQGAILSWSSAMVGALVCFYIARIFGRDVVEKFTSKPGLRQIDKFFERHGTAAIFIARLLPFMSFDIVSYAAGLTPMKFRSFFIATGLGQLPATIIYSYVGGMLTGGAGMFVSALLILFAITALVFLLKALYNENKKAMSVSQFVRVAYLSLIWALFLIIIAFQISIISMAVNMGFLLLGLFVAIVAVLLVCQLKWSYKFSWKFCLINLAAAVLVSSVIVGPARLLVIPASAVRQGLWDHTITLGNINLVLGGLLILGFVAVLALDFLKARRQETAT